MAEKLATLSFTDGTPPIDFPVLGGTEGPDVIDVRALYGKTGKFTYDPGFMSTASCRSQITYIDGDQGILMYRGYPIEQLAEHCDFLEVAYLILYGQLPNRQQKAEFDHIVLVDTSASQVGAHRTQALEVAKKFAESVGRNDRICLIAVDVTAEPLTEGFVTVGDAALAQAFVKLQDRVPLGATNLEKGIKSAIDLVDAKRATSMRRVR